MKHELLLQALVEVGWRGWASFACLALAAMVRIVWAHRLAMGDRRPKLNLVHWAGAASGVALGLWQLVVERAGWLEAVRYVGYHYSPPRWAAGEAGLLLSLGVGLVLWAALALGSAAASRIELSPSALAGWTLTGLTGIVMVRLGWRLSEVFALGPYDRVGARALIDGLYAPLLPPLRWAFLGGSCAAGAAAWILRRERKPTQPLPAFVVLSFGLVAFALTRAHSHDARLVGPIQDLEYFSGAAPEARECGEPRLAPVLLFYRGELVIDGTATRTGEELAEKLRELERKVNDLTAMVGDPPSPLNLNIQAPADAPVAVLAPWLQSARNVLQPEHLYVLGQKTTLLHSRTRGTLRHVQHCSSPFQLAAGGTPASHFATWGDLHAAAESGPLMVDLER